MKGRTHYDNARNHFQNRRTERDGSLIAEAQAEAEAIKDAIKSHMNEQDVEELIAGTHIIRWTTVLSNRFDSTSLKKSMPELYKAYTKQTTSRRFTVA